MLFCQTRIGWRERPFTLYKFRTMSDATDAAGNPLPDADRLTPFGQWLRTWSLDELPQLWNTLVGDMSLVGPRPERPIFVEQLRQEIRFYDLRHSIKPGVTGWAQIHHVPEDSLENTVRKLEYDLYYIKHMSPALDMLTMFHTAKAVILRIGAR